MNDPSCGRRPPLVRWARSPAMAWRIFSDALGQAVFALRASRLRSLLSILGVAIGILAVLAVSAVSRGGHDLIFRELETFGLRSIWVFRDSDDKDPLRAVRQGTGIDNDDLAAIDAGCCPALRRVTPHLFLTPQMPRLLVRNGERYSNAGVAGVGSAFMEINGDLLMTGRGLREIDISRRRNVAVIGPDVQKDLFEAQRDPVGSHIRIGNESFEVIGVLRPKSRSFLASIGSAGGQGANNRILIPYSVFQTLTGREEIQLLQAETTEFGNAEQAKTQLSRFLERRHRGQFRYRSESMAQYIATADQILGLVSLIGAVAASVSLVVGGLGIMNIMTTSVVERTREIGVRKAIGSSRADLHLQFLLEALIISLTGGVIGLALGIGGGALAAVVSGVSFLPPPGAVIAALLISLAVGLGSGYLPAARAARLRPVEALRHE